MSERFHTYIIPQSNPNPMHFRVPISTDSGNEIVNSRIRVFFPGNYEYFQADVIDYDPATNKHHLLYIIDREESDEDLSKEKWFILDTSKKSAKISKKRSDTPNTSPLPPPHTNTTNTWDGDFGLSAPLPSTTTPSYTIYVIPEIHDVLTGRNITEKVLDQTSLQLVQSSVRVSDPTLTSEIFNEVVKMTNQTHTLWRYEFKNSTDPNALLLASDLVNSQIQSVSNSMDSRNVAKNSKTAIMIPSALFSSLKTSLPEITRKCRDVDFLWLPHNPSSPSLFIYLAAKDDISLVKARDQIEKQVSELKCN